MPGKSLVKIITLKKTSILVFTISFCIILPLLLKDNIHSPYHFVLSKPFNSSAREENYKFRNDLEVLKSKVYLSRNKKLDKDHLLSQWKETAKFKLIIVIVSASRNHFPSGKNYNPRYLTQVTAKYGYLKLNRPSTQLTDMKLIVCDVDKVSHFEALNLTDYIPKISIYEGVPRSLRMNADAYEQEKVDYVHCLKQSLNYTSDYILIVEDDALPHDDLLEKLDHLFSYRLPKINNTFGYIKLFHPTRLNGYITGDGNRLLEWFASAGLMEHLIASILFIFGFTDQNSIDNRLIRYIFLTLLLLGIGRINVMQWRKISPHFYRFVPAPSCCTPALLFTPTSAKLMVDYLSKVTCRKGYAKDTAMETAGFKNWFFEPKIFTHIGVYSTLHKNLIRPDIVD
ncbi:TMEM246 [Bugula neritina]|uniref:TMEM246 n=1 Tax=Bugula neritina TaxID=10212 RepID=A0A7J7K1C0_BUGNE|nr:TMEM246 [Bugula neritina]